MLKTPRLHTGDQILNMLSDGREEVCPVEEGVVELSHFSLDMLIWGSNAPKMYMGYPKFDDDLYCCGVCDTIEQFLAKHRQRLQEDERTFIVGFTHIAKHPDLAGQRGGWRWRKWGPYIGDGTPTTEYLDDEPEFKDGVYVYRICQTAGPEKKHERDKEA